MKNITKLEKQKYLGGARKKKRDSEILPNYNLNLSVAENAITLKKSPGTVYKSLKENKIIFKNDSEYLKYKELYYNTSAENRTVRKMILISGVNKGKSERYLKKLKSEESQFKNVA